MIYLLWYNEYDSKEAIKILEQHGWKVLRINGSHHRMGKAGLRTTVPVHAKRDLGKGLLIYPSHLKMRTLTAHLAANCKRFSIEKSRNTVKYSCDFSQSKRLHFLQSGCYHLAS